MDIAALIILMLVPVGHGAVNQTHHPDFASRHPCIACKCKCRFVSSCMFFNSMESTLYRYWAGLNKSHWQLRVTVPKL